MTLNNALLRFFIGSLVLPVLVSVLSQFTPINNGAHVAIMIVVGLTYWICMSFSKSNGRYFTKNEKYKVIIGFTTINILLQIIATVLVVYTVKPGVQVSISYSTFITTFIIHGLIISVLVVAYEKYLPNLKTFR